jgi:N-acyl-D-aspartate/D-glutamate deacylase
MDFALIGGTVVDGTGREPVRECAVVVRDGQIAAVMPGLTDCHTRLTCLGPRRAGDRESGARR